MNIFIYGIIFMISVSSSVSAQVTDFYVWRHGETDANKSSVLSGGAPELHPDLDRSLRMSSLNEQGKQQAKELGDLIANKMCLELDVIYSSDLSRAVETAGAVVQAYERVQRSIEVRKNPQLREVLHGKFELSPKQARDEAAQNLMQNYLKNNLSGDDKFVFWKLHPLAGPDVVPGEVIDVSRYLETKETRPETIWQLHNRLIVELAKIAKANIGKKVGISTHGAVLCVLFNTPIDTEFNGIYEPPYYNSDEIKKGDKTIPASIKVKNCALMHFQYDHETNQLIRIND